MVNTEDPRSERDAFVRASASLRDRFEAQVVAASTWTDGVADALADAGEGVVEEIEAQGMALSELRPAGAGAEVDVRRLYDEARPARLASIARAWSHHHPGTAVPEIQLEVFLGAVAHAVGAAVQRGDVGELPERLPGLVALAPVAAV